MREESDDLLPGVLVGEYRVDELIGAGGFGKVYRAVHPVIGKRAAIKVLDRACAKHPSFESRFIAEARAVNRIRHRHIVDIFSFGVLEDGRLYLIMELLEGMTLREALRRQGPIALTPALEMLSSISRALDAVHAGGIVHRDLKPENIFLTFEDGVCFPKILDFGIAKMTFEEVGHKTRTGALMGSPWYMSPEQCQGLALDHRTDIYSLGVIAHEMLSGRCPFHSEQVVEVILSHVMEEPPRLSSVSSHSSALDGPLLTMLAKDPSDRPATAGAAIDALINQATDNRTGYADTLPPSLPMHSWAELGRAPSPWRFKRWLLISLLLGLCSLPSVLSTAVERPAPIATSVTTSSQAYLPEPAPAPLPSPPSPPAKERIRKQTKKPTPPPTKVPDDIENPFD